MNPPLQKQEEQHMLQSWLWISTLSLLGLTPLAERVSFLTEQLAYYTGPTVGELLNATCGNATELIIALFALYDRKVDVVKYSLLGSIISILLLVLGTSLFCGGLANLKKEQKYDRKQADVNSQLLLLGCLCHLLPLIFRYTTITASETIDSTLLFSRVVGNLRGHLDYSFASAWHPDGRILTNGNQDTTCRLWDIRNLSQSLDVLKGRMGAIRGIKFTSDGRFMAMAEPADFVHIYDTQSGYSQRQEIDLFGEIAGISSAQTLRLFLLEWQVVPMEAYWNLTSVVVTNI